MKRDWKKWFAAAGIRAIKTFAQAFLSMITVGAALSEIDWKYTASCAAVAAIYSLLTSLAGLPELDEEEGKGSDKQPESEELEVHIDAEDIE